MSYLVVLRGKPESKQPGVCTFTSFGSQTEFLREMTDLLAQYDIAAVDIDARAAEAMCDAVPAERLFNSALLQSIHQDGSFSMEMFRHEIMQIQILRNERCPQEIFEKAVSYASQSIKDPRVEGDRYRSYP